MLNNVVIYSKNDCPYCVLAKELLDSKHIYYKEINIPNDISAEEVKNAYKHHFVNEKVTVPIILIDNNFIGGYNNLQQVLGGS